MAGLLERLRNAVKPSYRRETAGDDLERSVLNVGPLEACWYRVSYCRRGLAVICSLECRPFKRKLWLKLPKLVEDILL